MQKIIKQIHNYTNITVTSIKTTNINEEGKKIFKIRRGKVRWRKELSSSVEKGTSAVLQRGTSVEYKVRKTSNFQS